MNHRRWILLLWLLIGSVGGAAETDPPRSLHELESAILGVLQQTSTPGAGVALIDRHGVRWAAGIGLADVANGRAADADTLFRVGSISKSFVATAVLMLVESGQLDLQDRVADLAPEIRYQNPWESSQPLRVVHLLEHTTGFDDIHLAEYALRGPNLSLREALEYHPDSRVSRAPPGLHYSYANSGPAIAAYIVEKITGQSFEEFAAQRIFQPLDMPTATFRLTPEAEQRLARGYWSDGVSEAPYEHLTPRPIGAANVSPRELGHFVRMLIGRGSYEGRRLLQRDSVERMERPTSTLAARSGVGLGYGLGNYTSIDDAGFVWHGHAGGLSSFVACYGYLPEQGVGFVLMLNAAQGEAYRRVRELLRSYLTVDLTPPSGVPEAEVPLAELQAWTGFYEPVLTRPELARWLTDLIGVVHVSPQHEELLVRSPLGETTRLVPLGEGLFRRPDDPEASVAFIEHDGERFVQGVIVGEGSLRKIPTWSAWSRWLGAALCVLLLASSLLYALVWVPRWLSGRSYLDMALRVLPLLAVLTLGGMLATFFLTEDVIGQFGQPTVRAYALWVGGWLFVLLSLFALWRALGGGSWGLRLYATLVAVACIATAIYLYSGGVLGLRTWEY